ncbi:MAG: class I SAM-dependent methyltransferase [Bacteroidota bacterium]
MKFIPIVLPLMILLYSCGNTESHREGHQSGHAHGHEHGHDANAFMNQRSFEELVASFESPERESWQQPDSVIALLGDIQGKTIMDIGAGTGYFSFRMAEKGARVIAADVDERFQSYIQDQKSERKDSLVSLRLLPFDSPKLTPEEVDHVIIVNTYHHIHDRIAYFQKVLSGLKVKGSLMVVDYKKEDSPHGPPQKHRMTYEQIEAELKEAGFPSIQVDNETLAYQYILMAYKTL